jgi:hypothetical protein
LERASNRKGVVYWKVKCDCGKEKEVLGNNLQAQKSCGCLAIRDLTGQRFNKLTVLSRADDKDGIRWNVRCDCGVEKVVSAGNLDNTLSCGCMNHRTGPIKDISGAQIGLLFIKKRLPDKLSKSQRPDPVYLCECECGNTCERRSEDLGKGLFSCGCINESPFRLVCKSRYIITEYQSNANKRNLTFELPDTQMEELLKGKCHYCGFSLEEVRSDLREFAFLGIDRLDNTKGYIAGNVVTCCKICNHTKKAMTELSFLAWVKRVSDYQNRKRL